MVGLLGSVLLIALWFRFPLFRGWVVASAVVIGLVMAGQAIGLEADVVIGLVVVVFLVMMVAVLVYGLKKGWPMFPDKDFGRDGKTGDKHDGPEDE